MLKRATMLLSRSVGPVVILLVTTVVAAVVLPQLMTLSPGTLATLQWLGTIACVLQSALCSGLTVGLTGINRLELEAMAASGDKNAAEILKLRATPFLLPFTLLWANVMFNVALPLFVNGLFPVWAAFLFSTVVITHIGEIFPVAVVSRYPLQIGAFLAPAVRVYQTILWPLSRPEAYLCEKAFGPEEIPLFSERVLRYVIDRHVKEDDSEIGRVEGIGADNFLTIDDISVGMEGEPLDPRSIIPVTVVDGKPQLSTTDEDFLRAVFAPRKKWCVLVDEASSKPLCLLDARDFLVEVQYTAGHFDPMRFCHRPLIVEDTGEQLGTYLRKLKVFAHHKEDDVIDYDAILVWSEGEHRLITGSDILGRLMRRIVDRVPAEQSKVMVR